MHPARWLLVQVAAAKYVEVSACYLAGLGACLAARAAIVWTRRSRPKTHASGRYDEKASQTFA